MRRLWLLAGCQCCSAWASPALNTRCETWPLTRSCRSTRNRYQKVKTESKK